MNARFNGAHYEIAMNQQLHGLTDQQIQHFDIFGFVIRRNVFHPEEIKKILFEFDRRLASTLSNAASTDTNQFNNWPNRGPDTPYIASLLEDPRIYLPSEQLLGNDAVPVHSNSNSYFEDTGWHPDATERHLLMIKNVMYLQPTTGERGSLRLIPGSHKSPLHDELLRIGLNSVDGTPSRFLAESGIRAEDIPCYVFCSEPGDVITFNQKIWHAAFGGYTDRRTCTFNFFSNPKTAEEKEDLHGQVEYYKTSRKLLGTDGPQYHPWWLSNPKDSARRARWIQWLEECKFIEAGNH